jgi:hypothetical protein
LFVDNVIVSKDEVSVSGPKGVLAKAALNELPNTPGEVITFVREWRPVADETGHWKLLISFDSPGLRCRKGSNGRPV